MVVVVVVVAVAKDINLNLNLNLSLTDFIGRVDSSQLEVVVVVGRV